MTRRLITLILVLAVAAAALIVAPIEFAAAQRPGQPRAQPQATPFRGFFDLLFGGQTFQPPPARVTRPPAAGGGPPAAVAAPAVAKDPQARKILVIGDFVGTVAAQGLDRQFAGETKLRVVDRSNPNSGLARQDYYDWVRVLPDILAAEHPDIVVTVLGANDRQMLSGNATAPFGMPDWEAGYTARVQGLAAALAAYRAPFFWVGTIPMRSTPEPDMAYLNDLYKPRVTAAGGTFVDVWDGFADENGHLVVSGPDVDGQIRPLRTPNGINFTDAGQAKLAFYVAREIRRLTGLGTGTVDLLAALGTAGHSEIGPDGRNRLVGPVISLNDPAPAAGTALAGDRTPASSASLLAAPKDAQSPQGLLIRGAALPAVKGRADDFTWHDGKDTNAATIQK